MHKVYGKTIYDTLEEIINPLYCALLLVDVTNDFYHPDGCLAKDGRDVTEMAKTLPRFTKLLSVCRAMLVPVVHIQNTVLPDGRSDSPAFIRFKTKAVGKLPTHTIEGTWGWEFLEGFTPQPGEAVVRKHRPSGFMATDLDQILRNSRVETVIVAGCVTEGCVQATAVDALFHDYYVAIPADCVASYEKSSHQAALRYLDIRAEVVDSETIIAALSSHTNSQERA